MFEHLKRWPRVLVTGPQRSGTRIGTTMIAHDLNYWPVYEEQVGTDSLNRLWKHLQTTRNTVTQCPALSSHVHLLALDDPELAVVLMRRSIKEIRASEQRIRWAWEKPELIREGILVNSSSAEAKYKRWDELQADVIGERGFVVEYSSLHTHPLWKPAPARVNFEPRQTR